MAQTRPTRVALLRKIRSTDYLPGFTTTLWIILDPKGTRIGTRYATESDAREAARRLGWKVAGR